jgi:LacI family transcriptional regulator, galactose operon repressor
VDLLDSAITKGVRERKRATLKTIAEATGFALTTVSRALKNEPDIGAETRAKVQAVAAKLGYRPDRAAQGLRTGRTLVVGLILDQTLAVAEFERRIIAGVSKVIYDKTAHNLVVLPHTDDADPVESVRYFVEDAQVDGLIFAHTTPQDERARYLLDRNVPFVTHGRTALSEQHAYFDFDNYAMTKQSVERLVRKGRRRLAMVAATPHLTCANHFLNGFYDGLRQSTAEGSVIPGLFLNEDPSKFREAARVLVECGPVPDGVVCGIETAAIGFVAGLQDAGLVVGRDVDVIAKSTSDILDYIAPPIDSFVEDLTLAGETLAHFLMKRIRGVPAEELQAVDQPRLCVRT